MRPATVSIALALCAAWIHYPLEAQFFLQCDQGSDAALSRLFDANLEAHEEHMLRLTGKFLDGHYDHRNSLPGFDPVSRSEIISYLEDLEPDRRAALIFYAQRDNSFCTWLLSPRTGLTSYVGSIEQQSYVNMDVDMRIALGVRGTEANRAPRKRGVEVVRPENISEGPIGELVEDMSELLFPLPIREALAQDSVNTLVVVPVGPIGTLPLAMLRLGGGNLIDQMSVSIAPGFFAFRGKPIRSARQLREAIVAGDPTALSDGEWEFPPLPGARAEAEAVAEFVGVEPLLGTAASKQEITSRLSAQPKTELIYLATHGIGDATNPLDGSFLLMSDGRWPATEVQNLSLTANPLVVLSACQTGLGKSFDVGVIGMARAWQRAGASAVVMTLWSVEDNSTADLMSEFLRLARSAPPDEALRQAMRTMRNAYPDPASWAGFTVLGVPTR